MRIRTLLNPFSCIQRFDKQIWHELFHNFQGLLDVEIGSGTGSFLTHYAHKNPQRAIVGLEIRYRLAEFIKQNIAHQDLTNAKIFWGNGHIGLEDMFENNSIDRIFIFHPDPWPKSRHRKRRLINDSFLEIIQRKLKPDGKLYLSTDVLELWNNMTETIKASQQFEIDLDEEFWTTLYQTRWHEISQQRQKILSYATFRKAP